MDLRKRRSDTDTGERSKRQSFGDSLTNYNRRTTENDANSSSSADKSSDCEIVEQKYTPTLFDHLNSKGLQHVVYEILDWLDINSLCQFSKTCKSFRRTAKAHFDLMYPSLAIDIGDEEESRPLHFQCFGDVVQHLQLSGASLDEFKFAATNVNRHLRELSFNRTNEDKKEDHIGKEHIDGIKRILENVRTVCATSCIFEKNASEYLLMNCKTIDGFGFTARKDMTYRFQFQKSSTLKSIEIVFEAKAKVLEILQTLQNKRLHLNELVLSFSSEHSDLMDNIFNLLDAMYESGVFKALHLNFDKKSLISDHIRRLSQVKGLFGVVCAYRINHEIENHMLDLAMLHNIKYLSIHWLFIDSTIVAQRLPELIELKVTETTMEAIVPFVRHAANLSNFHIKHIQGNRLLNANVLNNERTQMVRKPTAKLNIFIPEKIFIKMKWSSIPMKMDCVEIKREESYVPKKPLA